MRFSNDALRDLPTRMKIGETLWPKKHKWSDLEIIKKGDVYTHSSQYQQNPAPVKGGIFEVDKFREYSQLPANIVACAMFADTAQKTKERNDFSVLQAWALADDRCIYLIDQLRGKWTAPMLEQNAKEFWDKYAPSIHRSWGLSCAYIEDKSSGSSLIQKLTSEKYMPVTPVQRNTDKFFRAYGVTNYITQGYVYLPKGADWIVDYKDEFRKFTPLMTHKHDDQIDPTIDAIETLIINSPLLYR